MFHLTASPPHQNGAGRCGPIEHVRTQNNRENKNVPFDRISPETKRCWEVRANRACSYDRNDRENNNVPFDRISPTPILNAISKESAPRTSRARHSLPTSSDFYVTASLTKYVWLDGSLPVSQGMSLAEEMILYQTMGLPMPPHHINCYYCTHL